MEDKQPFKAVLQNDNTAIDKFTAKDWEAIVFATHTGMTTEEFQKTVRDWMATAKQPRFGKPYTRLVYQPMLELRRYLRRNGYRTYIVTGGGQDFARAYAREYGIPAEKIIGSALETLYEYNCNEQGILMREPKLLFEDNFSGKPEDIYLFIGRHPKAAFGNSTGDRQMLAYTQAEERLWRCLCSTTTPTENTPTDQRRDCLTQRSANLLKSCTTKRGKKAGASSA